LLAREPRSGGQPCAAYVTRDASLSVARRHRQRPLGFVELAFGATVLAQGVGRRLLKRKSICVVTQLLQVAHKRLQAIDVVSVCVEYPARAGIQERGIDWTIGAIRLPRAIRRPALLSSGHQQRQYATP